MLWERSVDDLDGGVWLVSALDEYSDDAGGGDDYFAQLKINPELRREMGIDVAESAVVGLFKVPTVTAKVLP
jgi:hypothetical protein